MENDATNKNTLDLGLLALLNSLAGEDVKPSAEIKPPEEVPLAAVVIVPIRNEYETLADASQWKELVLLCEQRLSASDSLEPRLWWITASLKTETMPVGLLAAPLDAATKDLVPLDTENNLKVLTAATLSSAASALEHSGDGELGISFLKRARSFDTCSEKALAEMLEREMSRLKDLSGLSTKQSADRSEKLKQLKTLRATIAIVVAPAILKKETSGRVISIENQAANTEDFKSKKSAHLYPMRTAPLGRVGALLAFLIVGALVLFFNPFRLLFSSTGGSPAFASANSVETLEMRSPILARIENVSAFDGLYYDLKNGDAVPKKAALVPATVQNAAPLVARSHAEKLPLSMAGPREPAEIQEAMLRPENPEDKNAKILFGGADAPAPKSSETSGTGTERQQAVQQFANKRVYRIVSQTKIVATPSHETEALGLLEPGEHVSAEATIDEWLRIRSAGGRIGFILMKDAVEE